MQVHCPQCGSIIPVNDVNLQTLAARCRQCNNLFSVADVVHADSAQASAIDANAPVPTPPRMRVEELGNRWSVTWRWFTPGAIFLIFFCGIWDPVVIITAIKGFTANPGWFSALFPVPFVVAGLLISYLAIASILNKTTISIDGSDLSIQIGPVPWRGNMTTATDAIRQVFFKPVNTSSRNRSSVWYGVYAVDKDTKLTQLVSGITDINDAIFLQRTLEHRLHLKPSPI